MIIVDINKKEAKDENGNILNIKVETENEKSNDIGFSVLKPIVIYGIN